MENLNYEAVPFLPDDRPVVQGRSRPIPFLLVRRRPGDNLLGEGLPSSLASPEIDGTDAIAALK
jgi:hypothetical protein